MTTANNKQRQAVLIGVWEYDHCTDSRLTHQCLVDLASRLVDGGWGCPPVDDSSSQKQMRDRVGDALKSEPSELLVYFTGHAFQVGEDLWLAAANHDPYASVGEPRGISLQWLFQTVRAAGVSVLIVILDCHGDGFVDTLVLPRNLVLPRKEETLQYAILASGSDDEHRGEFTKALLEGLGKPVEANADSQTKKQAQAKGKDGLERVTPMSLAMYFEDIQTVRHVKPIFRACLRQTVTIRNSSTLNAMDRSRLLKLFRDGPEGEFKVVDVDADYECPEEISAKGENRSRPDETILPPYPGEVDGLWTEKMVDMEVFKHLRDAGFLETCRRSVEVRPWEDRDINVYWACIHNQAVRLTPMGKIAWQYYFNQQN